MEPNVVVSSSVVVLPFIMVFSGTMHIVFDLTVQHVSGSVAEDVVNAELLKSRVAIEVIDESVAERVVKAELLESRDAIDVIDVAVAVEAVNIDDETVPRRLEYAPLRALIAIKFKMPCCNCFISPGQYYVFRGSMGVPRQCFGMYIGLGKYEPLPSSNQLPRRCPLRSQSNRSQHVGPEYIVNSCDLWYSRYVCSPSYTGPGKSPHTRCRHILAKQAAQ